MGLRKKKLKTLVNCKSFTWLIIVFILLLLTVCTLSLQQYLYHIQTEERIRKIEDATDFVITIHPQKRSTKTYQFEHENTYYYFEGIEQVYVSYGTTKIFFEDAIKKGLISIKSVINNCVLETEEANYKKYQHINKDNSKNYYVTVIEGDSTTVIFST